MFRKRRIKKEYPPGTFIPTPIRIMAILQLCIAFTLILWYISEPFVGEIFNIKSRLLIYQEVIGLAPTSDLNKEALEHLERNQHRFQTLTPEKQNELTTEMAQIQNELKKPFFEKFTQIFKIFSSLSSYKLLWLALSIIIPIMLLKKVDGATEAVWILPLLVILYAFDSSTNSSANSTTKLSKEAGLFPTEQELLSENHEIFKEGNIFEEQQQLILGWKRYLASKWANQLPSNDLETLEFQAEDGLHAFNIERLKLRSQDEVSRKQNKRNSESVPFITLYFLWNLMLAFISFKYCALR